MTTRRALLGGLLAAVSAGRAGADVAILRAGAAPQLVLVDAERLDGPLLARLASAGFGQELQPVADCESVGFGLLTERIRQAGRIVAMLSASNHALVLASLRTLGGSVVLDLPAGDLGRDAPADLLALRDALGEAAAGLHAVVARLSA